MLPVLTLSLIGGIFAYGFNSVRAETSQSELSPMIQKLVEKFNLNKDDVSKFVTEQKTVNQQERQKEFEDKLAQLVKDKKLTESQKTALVAKHNEMKANRQNIKDTTREERQTKMKAEREAYEAWAKSQGIDLSLLKPMGRGLGMHKGI